MLKSYEAVYDNGHLHWLGIPPPKEIEKRHLLVVVDLEDAQQKDQAQLHQLLQQTRGCIKPLRSIDNIDAEISSMRLEWDR